jgi:glycosyltransferase involved in cell wall biosynthesis
MKHILIIGALPESLLNFRGELIKDFIATGLKVSAAASNATLDQIKCIRNLGVEYHQYSVARNKISIGSDLLSIFLLFKLILKTKPDIVFSYTITPIIWSGIVLLFFKKIKFFALVEGLGYAFGDKTLYRKCVKFIVCILYKLSLSKSNQVIFLNVDNADFFRNNKLVNRKKIRLIDGIGVDLEYFKPTPLPDMPIVFLCISRLLIEKGLREYVEAARIVKIIYPQATFKLVATSDLSSDRVHPDEVNQWKRDNFIELLSPQSDVRPFIKNSHIYVLASYHEGMPRTTMEAMAMARPIITTDVPGCRETVNEGVNGFLVPKQNAQALADRMIWMVENNHLCQQMGQASHDMAIKRFDVRKINKQIMKILNIPMKGILN